eukprot:m.71912 g.71912  ORF g.71912 m.71912 type:complete len:308 (+) comp7971_c0_seq2:848-1771(+)
MHIQLRHGMFHASRTATSSKRSAPQQHVCSSTESTKDNGQDEKVIHGPAKLFSLIGRRRVSGCWRGGRCRCDDIRCLFAVGGVVEAAQEGSKDGSRKPKAARQQSHDFSTVSLLKVGNVGHRADRVKAVGALANGKEAEAEKSHWRSLAEGEGKGARVSRNKEKRREDALGVDAKAVEEVALCDSRVHPEMHARGHEDGCCLGEGKARLDNRLKHPCRVRRPGAQHHSHPIQQRCRPPVPSQDHRTAACDCLQRLCGLGFLWKVLRCFEPLGELLEVLLFLHLWQEDSPLWRPAAAPATDAAAQAPR